MCLHIFLFIQALLTDIATAQSAPSLRKVNYTKVTNRKLLDKNDFDCDKGCTMTKGGPVCGDDNISYQNECLAWCQNVGINSVGECDGHHTMSDDTYDTSYEVTKDTLDRFKDESFVFVAKRNFKKSNQHERSAPKGTKAALDTPTNKNESGNNDPNTIYALRITDEGHEYLAKIDINDLQGIIGNYSSVPRHPLDGDDDNKRRSLNENQRGIVGSDSRSKVCLHASCYPYSTIGEFDSPTEQGGCTGTVISPSAVITAAHCFYANGEYTDLDRFAPGRYRKYRDGTAFDKGKGQPVEPYGIWKAQFKTIFTEWITTGQLRYDIAIVHFHPTLYRGDNEDSNDLNIGDVVGYMGIAATTNDSDELQKATLTGYPYDKPDGEMWTSGLCAGGFIAGADDAITYHACDSVKGNDGSALLDLENEVVYGINIADVPIGPDHPDQALANIGVIINNKNIGLIKAVAGLYGL